MTIKICIIGAGYVGLVSATCLAELGASVTCVDVDAAKIARLSRGELPIYEPRLPDLLDRARASGRLRFAIDPAEAVRDADVVFIAVGTPTRRGDGHADLSHVLAAARQIAPHLRPDALVVTKSTVPVGTTRQLQRLLAASNPGARVASNPEFLREGSAVHDFMHPDRIVFGVDCARDERLLHAVYAPLVTRGTRTVTASIETAELIKYASNAFLATKLSFLSELTELSEATGADIDGVTAGMALDPRIGAQYLAPGPGFGGSCLPKDVKGYLRTAQQHGVSCRVVETVMEANAAHQARMVRKIRGALGGSEAGKTIAVLGLTFKADTDDMRYAPALAILPSLADRGAHLRAHDPQGMREARPWLPPEVTMWPELDTLCDDADCVVVMTEWPQYRHLDLARIATRMNRAVMVDLRNLFDPARMSDLGFAYHGVGRQSRPHGGKSLAAPRAALA